MSRAALYALWLWLFAVIGAALAVLGPALPELRREFGVSLSMAGLLFTLQSGGYVAGTLAAGPLADARGHRATVFVGVLLLGGGMLLAALAPSWPAVLMAIVPAGTGFGCIDVGLNAAIGVAIAEPRRRAAVLNLLHAGFPAGTLAAPAALSWALGHGFTWRSAFLATALAALASLAAWRRPRWPSASRPARPNGLSAAEPLRLLALLRERRLRRLAVLQGLYVGTEVSVAGWVATHLIETFGATPAAGSLGTSAYWGGFLIGRPVVAVLAGRIGPYRLLPWLCLAGAAFALAGAAAPAALAAAGAYALAGLAICGIFPTVMALALEGRRGDAGSVAALVTGAGALGSFAWPWATGAAAQALGVRLAMAVAAAPLLIMLPLALPLLPATRASRQTDAPSPWAATGATLNDAAPGAGSEVEAESRK